MKAFLYLTITMICLLFQKIGAQEHKLICHPSESINGFAEAKAMDRAMDKIVKSGTPGAAIAIFSDKGWWYSGKGYSRIEDKTTMQISHLQYLQSISKTYHAVAALKLYESGQLKLDSPITAYLPKNITRYIAKAESITVKMLLNHTSGIREYNFNPNYVTQLLQSPEKNYKGEDYLKFIDGKSLDFEPGSRYSYRNTNYVLLALILDELTGNHAQFIEDEIFRPLELSHTFYRNKSDYLNKTDLVDSYWDRYGTGIVENASYLQRSNVMNMIGDDGIVTTPIEAIKFLKGLIEGKLLSESTLKLMKNWVHRDNGEPAYGLGLSYIKINGVEAYGHSGGGIGAGCELYYVPEKNLYFFIAINLGTITETPLHKGIEEVRKEVYSILSR